MIVSNLVNSALLSPVVQAQLHEEHANGAVSIPQEPTWHLTGPVRCGNDRHCPCTKSFNLYATATLPQKSPLPADAIRAQSMRSFMENHMHACHDPCTHEIGRSTDGDDRIGSAQAATNVVVVKSTNVHQQSEYMSDQHSKIIGASCQPNLAACRRAALHTSLSNWQCQKM